MKLKDKVVVITGAGRGIGKGIALEFIKEGAKVVINDVNAETAKTALQEIKDLGGDGIAVVADISIEEQAARLIKETVDSFGTIDILVNNAGITRDSLVTKITEEDWDLVMDINLKGPFNLIKAAFKVMAEKKSGKIINLASISGQMGNIGQSNYCASKAGVIGLTKCVAREGAAQGINVNAIAPGFIDTEMTQVIPEKVKEKIIQQIPMKRIGKPKDIGRLCIFLASEDADYITGQVIAVNGGWYM